MCLCVRLCVCDLSVCLSVCLSPVGNLEAKTLQHQTPIHYAVRGDAVDALHLLVERGGENMHLVEV